MTKYTITSGTPSAEERAALEEALKHHKRPDDPKESRKSLWSKPQLRIPLPRKV